ncbi:MAG: phage tail sheath subtilisin-like domain-containing protein [Paludibacteraceae bacterium]|nr:phage tail sheath subtilisin-like domain-containing protein [Paludibacteraceae bacterium]
MAQYKTPGVYVEEISKFPPSVAGVATAIPAFIGYTKSQPKNGNLNPVKVSSLLDFESKFGERPSYANKDCVLYDSMRLFYDNGGGECYVVSVGKHEDSKNKDNYPKAIDALEKVDEVTLVLFPDAAKLFTANELGDIQKKALEHCAKMGDRFAILDISLKKDDSQDTSAQNNTNKKEGDGDDINQVEVTTPKVDATSEELCDQFRNNIGTNNLSYGAAYYPYVITSYSKDITYDEVAGKLNKLDQSLKKKIYLETAKNSDKYKDIFAVTGDLTEKQEKAIDQAEKEIEADRLFKINEIIAKSKEYQEKVAEMEAKMNILPPSGAIAGIICSTDRTKGVWQAPANVSLAGVRSLSEDLTDDDQAKMNITSNGKSINAIRKFTGKGLLVWGARTLDGNSNEWKYIPVRRLFNYIEESVQKSTSWAVFQPNDANTWVKIQCQIENFLTSLWRDGALAGSTPDKAFYVKVGLNETMTSDDILNGNLIVEIGLAAVRPAEFVVLKFSHKVQE